MTSCGIIPLVLYCQVSIMYSPLRTAHRTALDWAHVKFDWSGEGEHIVELNAEPPSRAVWLDYFLLIDKGKFALICYPDFRQFFGARKCTYLPHWHDAVAWTLNSAWGRNLLSKIWFFFCKTPFVWWHWKFNETWSGHSMQHTQTFRRSPETG